MAQRQDPLEDFRATFRLDELTVAESGGWVLSTRPGQLTLGAMVLSIQSGATGWAQVSAVEGQGLTTELAKADHLATSLFGADRINVICLMMKDPVIHFHVIPRYSSQVERYGRTWVDTDWPKPPTFGGADDEPRLLGRITEELRRAYRE